MLGAAGLVLFIVLIGVVASMGRGNQRKVLGEVAAANGLAYTPEGIGHRMEGMVNGRRLTMTAQPNPQNRVQEERWILELGTQPPSGFAVTKRRFLSRVSDGTREIVSGDRELDGAALTESADVEGANAYLTDARRKALRELVSAGGMLYGGKLMLIKPGLDVSTQKLTDRLRMLSSVAAAID